MAGNDDAATLRRECENYALKYGLKKGDVERGLEAYAAHVFAQEDGFNAVLDGLPTREADLSERICRAKDLGIDAVLQDDAGKRMILIQAAWRKKAVEEEKVAMLFDAPDRLLAADYLAGGSEQIQDLLADFAFAMQDGWEIILKFVTSTRVGTNERLQSLVAAKNVMYAERGQPIECQLFGESELLRRDEELRSATMGSAVPQVTFKLQEDNFVELKTPYRTLVGVIKANELVDLYKRRGVENRLFNMNIRLPLFSKKVNPAITKTALDPEEGKHFFYYNNGVSAVCSSYDLEGNVVTADKFQIINGAQTVSALVNAFRRSPNAQVNVLFRMTETVEEYGGSFTSKIIEYNNTQNPVKAADFFANDPIQVWLRDHLPDRSGRGPLPSFYYVHKSGYKPKGATGRGVSIELAAALRHAYLYGPVPGYKEPRQFFDPARVQYWEAFGTAGVATESWTEDEVAQFGAALTINDRIIAAVKKLKADDSTKNFPEARFLLRLSRYGVGLSAVGLEAIRQETFNDYPSLIASTASFDKYVEPVLTSARRAMRNEWNRRTMLSSDKQVRPEYNFARDTETWNALAEQVRQEVLTEVLPAVR